MKVGAPRIKIKFRDGGNFEVWQENGQVKQSGQFHLPEVLATYTNTPAGRREAGAFIRGMKYVSQIH